jgi:hypothetical protein
LLVLAFLSVATILSTIPSKMLDSDSARSRDSNAGAGAIAE